MKLLERWRKKTEVRAAPSSWDLMQAGTLGWPYAHSQHLVENLATVSTCVSLISSAIASLPAYVYQVSGKVKTELPDHPLQILIDQGVNERQSWFDFVQSLLADTLLHGNSLATVSRDARGMVTRLEYTPWRMVSPQYLPSGRLRYDLSPVPPTGQNRRLLDGEVLHLRDRSDDGYLGRSRLARAAESVAVGLAQERYALGLYHNGVRPSGALEVPGTLSQQALHHLRESMEQMHAGPTNAGRFMVLDSGVVWKQMSISPDDAEFLASRRFTVEELARLFDVPPPMIGHLEHATLSNVEALARVFLNLTLAPWVRKIEQAVKMAVLVEPQVLCKLDTEGFIQGDVLTRWQAHQIGIGTQVLTPNEVRLAEGYNPRPGGDEVVRQPGQV